MEIDQLPLLELLVEPLDGPFSVILRPFLQPFFALTSPEKTSSVYGAVLLPALKLIDTFVLTFFVFATARAREADAHGERHRDYEKSPHWCASPLCR